MVTCLNAMKKSYVKNYLPCSYYMWFIDEYLSDIFSPNYDFSMDFSTYFYGILPRDRISAPPPSVLGEVLSKHQKSINISYSSLQHKFYLWLIINNKPAGYYISYFGKHKWIPFFPSWFGHVCPIHGLSNTIRTIRRNNKLSNKINQIW